MNNLFGILGSDYLLNISQFHKCKNTVDLLSFVVKLPWCFFMDIHFFIVKVMALNKKLRSFIKIKSKLCHAKVIYNTVICNTYQVKRQRQHVAIHTNLYWQKKSYKTLLFHL